MKMHCTWCGALEECAPAINGDWTCDPCADRPPTIGRSHGYGPQRPREDRADDDPPNYAVPAWTDPDTEEDYQ